MLTKTVFISISVLVLIIGRVMKLLQMSFDNKVVIVTGAGSGIGAATAIQFAKEGANVVAVDMNDERVKNIGAKIETIGKKPLLIHADVAKDEEAKTVIKETIEKLGRLDVLVNNAGVAIEGSILNGNLLDTYDEMVPVNLRAVIHLTMLAAPHLMSSKGNIVNISSVGSLSVNVMYLAYCITKAAVEHFTRGAALELAPFGVRVNSIHPGLVLTNIVDRANSEAWDKVKEKTPLKRISEPEEIADLIIFLASDKAKSITGSAYVADNGYQLCL